MKRSHFRGDLRQDPNLGYLISNPEIFSTNFCVKCFERRKRKAGPINEH